MALAFGLLFSAPVALGATEVPKSKAGKAKAKGKAGAPAGFLASEVADIIEVVREDGVPVYVVLLRTTARPDYPARLVPIWIGGTEALAIQLRLSRTRPPRPLTHGLLEAIMEKLGATLDKVYVEDLRDDVFLGRIFVRTKTGRIVDMDARPSDSIALAVGARAPIYVARKVADAAGIDARDLAPGEPSLKDVLRGKKGETTL